MSEQQYIVIFDIKFCYQILLALCGGTLPVFGNPKNPCSNALNAYETNKCFVSCGLDTHVSVFDIICCEINISILFHWVIFVMTLIRGGVVLDYFFIGALQSFCQHIVLLFLCFLRSDRVNNSFL